MRRRRSPRARKIALVAIASLVVALGLGRWTAGPSLTGSPIRRVDSVDHPATHPTDSGHEAERRASSSPSPAPDLSPSAVPSVPAGAATAPPVFDLATLARREAPEPASDDDRFRTNDKFTADDLAHPERYFDAAERTPELQRTEERHDALEYFLAYRARLERDLAAAGGDADKRAAVVAVIARYDAAIARLQSAIAPPAP